MMRLDGKVALITGGTSGIGQATAELFAAEGAKVAITGRNIERGAAIVEQVAAIGGDAIFVQADVRLAEDCRRSVERTVETFGRIDALFNNAGVYVANDTVACSEEEWDAQVGTPVSRARS